MKLYVCSKCRGEFPASAFYPDRTSHPSPISRYCKECKKRVSNDRAKNHKLKAVKYKGGKCEICGYNKRIEALEFHHIDPSEKDPNFSSFVNWGWERIKKEIDNCQLLCANCHREVEYKE